jgi:hypothetical protein
MSRLNSRRSSATVERPQCNSKQTSPTNSRDNPRQHRLYDLSPAIFRPNLTKSTHCNSARQAGKFGRRAQSLNFRPATMSLQHKAIPPTTCCGLPSFDSLSQRPHIHTCIQRSHRFDVAETDRFLHIGAGRCPIQTPLIRSHAGHTTRPANWPQGIKISKYGWILPYFRLSRIKPLRCALQEPSNLKIFLRNSWPC